MDKGVLEELTPGPLCNSNKVRELHNLYIVQILFIIIMVLNVGGSCKFWSFDEDGNKVTSSQARILEFQGNNMNPYSI